MKILDIGCGRNKAKGAIGIDIDKNSEADIFHNLDVFPYPFDDNEFDLILCSHIIEHIIDVKKFMEEIYRIAKPNALIKGITPHFSNPCAYYDPTHKHYFSINFLKFFSKSSNLAINGFVLNSINKFLECFYLLSPFSNQIDFEITKKELYFPRCYRWVGISFFANRYPELYEFYFSGILKARDIIFELKVVK